MTMPNQPGSQGTGKWWAGFASAFLATWLVAHLEKDYGVDFKQMEVYGLNAIILKSSLEGTFVSFFVWVTPAHLVDFVTQTILFIKNAFKKWRDACNSNQEN